MLANVNTDGTIIKIDVLSSSGFGVLDTAAVKTIKKWQLSDVTRATEIEIPIKFVLTKIIRSIFF